MSERWRARSRSDRDLHPQQPQHNEQQEDRPPPLSVGWHKMKERERSEQQSFRDAGYRGDKFKPEWRSEQLKAGDHDCEYDSESEDSHCKHCGLTSGEAVKYFESQARSEQQGWTELKTKVFEALGEASMQWDPRPSGVFDSTECGKVGERLWPKITTALAKSYQMGVDSMRIGVAKGEGTEQQHSEHQEWPSRRDLENPPDYVTLRDDYWELHATLAAERKITFEAQQAALREGIRAGELEQQLAAERQRADEAEQELWTMRAGDKVKDDQLLSAQAAIEEHNKTYQVFKQIKVDLSALREHDDEVRRPLVDLLEWIDGQLKGPQFPSERQIQRRIADALAKVKENK